MQKITAVVPAAGLSRRYGGQNKLLQPWKDTTVVGAVVRALLAADLPVILVTGRDAEEVAAACPGANPVFNPLFEEGLGTSIAQGARSVPEGHAILIALGDMPDLEPDTVRTVVARYEAEDEIVAPVYESEAARPGHPVLFGSAYKEELIRLTGDEGARGVIRAHREKLRLAPIRGILTDIDHPNPQEPPAR
jgi:molybdenum cofactor cytidylyltransferase